MRAALQTIGTHPRRAQDGVDLPELTRLGKRKASGRPLLRNDKNTNSLSFPNASVLAHTRLPAAYEVAKLSLANCDKMDECQNWADKAEALASYAHQSKDDTLQQHAIRIQARAIRRVGILIKQIPSGNGARDGKRRDGADTPLTRTQAETDAGLSARQRNTALRVASVDEVEFEAAIESTAPPTVAKIAEAGIQHKPLIDLQGISPERYKEATKVGGLLRSMTECIRHIDAAQVAGAFQPHEIATIKGRVHTIDAWLDAFITHLGD